MEIPVEIAIVIGIGVAISIPTAILATAQYATASNIVISELKVTSSDTISETLEGIQDNSTISKGSLDLEFRVTDGIGNPIPGVNVETTFFYQSCQNGRNGLGSDLSMDDYYNKSGLVRAKIPLLKDLEPGVYNSLFIDAQSHTATSYQQVRDIVTVELSNGRRNNDILQAKLIGVQTVGSDNISPPKWPAKTSAIDIDGDTLTVTSDNRICDYHYSLATKILTLHVSSTELPQFMEVSIPLNLTGSSIKSSIYADINGFKPTPEVSENGDSYVLTFKYTGCVLDLYTSCEIHVHGIKALTNSSSTTDESLGNSAIPCTYDFTVDMHQNARADLDNDKAIGLATSNSEFQSKVQGHNATFNSIFTTWKTDKQSCISTLETVNVVYSIYDKGNVRNVVATLDPGLTKVINVTEQEAAYYGPPSSGEQNQISNPMYMIGIGAAIAGIVAFMTLRKIKK